MLNSVQYRNPIAIININIVFKCKQLFRALYEKIWSKHSLHLCSYTEWLQENYVLFVDRELLQGSDANISKEKTKQYTKQETCQLLTKFDGL